MPRTARAAVAVAACAAALTTPSASALPPIADWPLGFTCHISQTLDPTPGSDDYLFSLQGGPLLPVTDKGEQVTDVAVSCSVKVVPEAYPADELAGSSTNYAGVAYFPPVAKMITTGSRYTITYCSDLTWTDSTGTPRTGGSCVSKTVGS